MLLLACTLKSLCPYTMEDCGEGRRFELACCPPCRMGIIANSERSSPYPKPPHDMKVALAWVIACTVEAKALLSMEALGVGYFLTFDDLIRSPDRIGTPAHPTILLLTWALTMSKISHRVMILAPMLLMLVIMTSSSWRP